MFEIHVQNHHEILENYRSNYLKNFTQNHLIKIVFLQSKLSTDNPTLQKTIPYIFNNPGKLIRPLLNLILNDLINKGPVSEEQLIWASATEILHVSSLVHDDILDNSPTRRSQPSAHIKFTKAEALFTANFLIGRTGRSLSQLNNPQLYETYSTIIDNLSSGEHLQARKNKNFQNISQLQQDYLLKTYYKTGSLMSNSALGVGLLHDVSQQTLQRLFRIGQHLGMAFQLMDDVLDFTGETHKMGKEVQADIKEGLITAPLVLILHNLYTEEFSHFKNIETWFAQGTGLNQEQVQVVAELVQKFQGVERGIEMARRQVTEAIRLASEINNNTDGVKALGLLFIGRDH